MSREETPSYPFDADRAEEERRLIALGGLSEPNTERVFRQAGLGAGMRVLDLGAGAGDVALLVARLVGPQGSVLGVERSAEAVARAQRRIAQAGCDNVSFVQGDVSALDEVLDVGEIFDAVVGRAVLMYLSDPAVVLRASAQWLRPGGLLCFREPDMTYDWVPPPSPLWDQVRGWFLQTATHRCRYSSRSTPRRLTVEHQAAQTGGGRPSLARRPALTRQYRGRRGPRRPETLC